MARSNLLTGLETKFATLSGEARALDQRITKIEADYARLDALKAEQAVLVKGAGHVAEVIKLLDPEWIADTVAPRTPYTRRIPLPLRQCSRLAAETLRTANEPLTAREIAIQVLERSGLEDPSSDIRIKVTNTVDATLRQYRKKGLVVSDDSWPAKWRLLPEPHC